MYLTSLLVCLLLNLGVISHATPISNNEPGGSTNQVPMSRANLDLSNSTATVTTVSNGTSVWNIRNDLHNGTQLEETCYQLTTFDHKKLVLTGAGKVVVKDLYAVEDNSSLYDFDLHFLDPLKFSVEYTIEDYVFLWEVISPEYSSNSSLALYLSAECGEELLVKPSVKGRKIGIDGHFSRHNSSDGSNFRYNLYGSDYCYLQIQPSGEIHAVNLTYPDLLPNLHRFPVHNSLFDLSLEVVYCLNASNVSGME